ncbi:hypothetical protein DH2020_012047 [Rehmannia glutinosa]|uniref:Transmembrane protein n=1 Tax=Rehmannia glutinosa TaxID=99300 RepID=A0ABR0XF72_REHGL
MSTHSPSLWRVLSETWRIIIGHPRHFLALSVLFLLPISFASIIYTFLVQPTSLHSHYLQSLFLVSIPDPKTGNSQLLISILYILSVFLFSLCATPSITYSTFTAFYGKPVKFVSSLKSILVSFFPLLATLFVTEIILGLIIFAFALLMLVAYNGLVLLGVEMDYNSGYFLVFVTVIAVFLVGLLVYLLVEWCLSNAVVVLESKWGFAPLKRSSYLVKGMRKVARSIMVLFGILGGLSSMWYSNLIANAGGSSKGWIVVQMAVYVVFSTLLSLYGMAANTVLFVYCKELHGKMVFQRDEEMGREYVRLATDVNVV